MATILLTSINLTINDYFFLARIFFSLKKPKIVTSLFYYENYLKMSWKIEFKENWFEKNCEAEKVNDAFVNSYKNKILILIKF